MPTLIIMIMIRSGTDFKKCVQVDFQKGIMHTTIIYYKIFTLRNNVSERGGIRSLGQLFALRILFNFILLKLSSPYCSFRIMLKFFFFCLFRIILKSFLRGHVERMDFTSVASFGVIALNFMLREKMLCP